jgi:hypothetical protein
MEVMEIMMDQHYTDAELEAARTKALIESADSVNAQLRALEDDCPWCPFGGTPLCCSVDPNTAKGGQE